MRLSSKTRALIVCCGLAAGFTIFSYRLVQVQVAKHDEYRAKADENHGLRQTIYARRGMIQDVHGLALAQNEPVKTVVADGALVKDRRELARLLAKPLGLTEEALEVRAFAPIDIPWPDLAFWSDTNALSDHLSGGRASGPGFASRPARS